MRDMDDTSKTLLKEIEAFLADTGMGESYFGKRATGNSELVARLRNDGRVWPETVAKARSFMKQRRALVRKGGCGAGAAKRQVAQKHNGEAAA